MFEQQCTRETEDFAILFVMCSFCSFESTAFQAVEQTHESGGGLGDAGPESSGSSRHFKLLAPAFHNNVMGSILFRLPFRQLQTIPKDLGWLRRLLHLKLK